MASFSGTLDKCKACDKKVYVVDMVTTDGVCYHQNCFKCSHCKGKLVLGRFTSIDGVLYCTPHFEQLFREGKIQNHTPKKPKEGEGKLASKLSAMFSGTQEKCFSCKKTVYPLEKITLEGENYHKLCCRCAKGGCLLTHANYAALDGVLYCKAHFAQLFKEKGSYSYLSKSISIKKGPTTAPTEDPAPEEAAPVEPEENSTETE